MKADALFPAQPSDRLSGAPQKCSIQNSNDCITTPAPSDQYIAFVDAETGECGERRLNHREEEAAEEFYRELAARGVSVRVGLEAD